MSLYYITGVSGSGKSSILQELRRQGYEAYGVDEDVYADWVDRQTGKVEVLPQNEPNFDIHEWFSKHGWHLNVDKVRQLKTESGKKNTPVFLCGAAEDDDKAWDAFDAVFALHLEESAIRQRILERTGNDYGKKPEEMENILKWHRRSEKTYHDLGAIFIDASQPLSTIVSELARQIQA